ncbi:MAG: hypothetical protein AB1599_02440 [Planctomycetota bacterium]
MKEDNFSNVIRTLNEYLVLGHSANISIVINRHPKVLIKIMLLWALLEAEKNPSKLNLEKSNSLRTEILFRFLTRRDFTSPELMDFLKRNLSAEHLFFNLVGQDGILTKIYKPRPFSVSSNEDGFREKIKESAVMLKLGENDHFTTKALERVMNWYNYGNEDTGLYWFNVLVVITDIPEEIAKWLKPALCLRFGIATNPDTKCPKGYKLLSEIVQNTNDLNTIYQKAMDYFRKNGVDTSTYKIFAPEIINDISLTGGSLGFALLGAIYLGSKGITLPSNYALMGEVDFDRDKIIAVGKIKEKTLSAINNGIKVFCIADDGISQEDKKFMESNQCIEKIFLFNASKSIQESLKQLKQTLFPLWYRVLDVVKWAFIILILAILLEWAVGPKRILSGLQVMPDSFKGNDSTVSISLFDKLMTFGDDIHNKIIYYAVLLLLKLPTVLIGFIVTIFLIIWIPFFIGKCFNNVFQELIDYLFLGKARYHKPLLDKHVNIPQWQNIKDWLKKVDKNKFYYLMQVVRIFIAYLSFIFTLMVTGYILGFLEKPVSKIIERIPLVNIKLIIIAVGYFLLVGGILYAAVVCVAYVYDRLEPLSQKFKPY